jgi:hypothetical protein
MPVTYRIDAAKHLIHTKCIGDVNPEEIVDHFQELARDPNRPDWLNVLLDLTEESSLPETQDLREVSHHLGELLRNIRFGACAIVAPEDALFGMMRMFEVFTRDYFAVTRVFRQVAEAENWIESTDVHPQYLLK